jgi:hypothetical protein
LTSQNIEPVLASPIAGSPQSSWHEFVPYQRNWGCAIWIEISRETVAPQFIAARDLLTKWTTEGPLRHTIMPRIEAAHIGSKPKDSRSAFVNLVGGVPDTP